MFLQKILFYFIVICFSSCAKEKQEEKYFIEDAFTCTTLEDTDECNSEDATSSIEDFFITVVLDRPSEGIDVVTKLYREHLGAKVKVYEETIGASGKIFTFQVQTSLSTELESYSIEISVPGSSLVVRPFSIWSDSKEGMPIDENILQDDATSIAIYDYQDFLVAKYFYNLNDNFLDIGGRSAVNRRGVSLSQEDQENVLRILNSLNRVDLNLCEQQTIDSHLSHEIALISGTNLIATYTSLLDIENCYARSSKSLSKNNNFVDGNKLFSLALIFRGYLP